MAQAIGQQSMGSPFVTKKRPPSTGMDSVVRFSDVAQFVGLSLLRDPALARPKVRKKANSGGAKVVVKEAVDKAMRPASAEDRARLALDSFATAQYGRETLPEVNLPDIVSAERSDQLRTQLQWLRAERRAEQEELRKLEHSLSDAVLAEKKAHDRAQKHREMRDFHRKRNNDVEQKMNMLREELRAGERAARQLEAYEMERQNAPGSYGESLGRQEPGQSSEPGSPKSPTLTAAESHTPYSQASPHSQAQSLRLLATTGDSVASASHSDSMASPSDSRQPSMKHSASAPVMALTVSADSGNMVRGSATSPIGATSPIEARPGSSNSAKGGQRQVTRPVSNSKPKVSALANMPSPVVEEDWRDAPDEDKREAIRRRVVTLTGCTCKQVFRKLDVNNSGVISLGDFATGLTRLGVNWQAITGLRRERDIFRLFDENRDGAIDILELFPSERNPPPEEAPSTPDFWKRWCRENRDVTKDADRDKARLSKWQPDGPEEELGLMMGAVEYQKEVTFKKKWMRSTFKRLKSRGKTDARCREIVALHLPRGTGPKDREDVHTFSKLEVKHCTQEYMQQVNDPARTIQKELFEMREQRRLLQTSRQKLYSVAMEPFVRHQQEQERKNLMANMAGGFSLLGKPKDPNQAAAAAVEAAAAPVVDESSSFAELEKRCENMDIDQMEDVFRVWMKYADAKTEVITKNGFVKLLEDLNNGKRTMVVNDITTWWEQLSRLPGAPNEGEMLPGAASPSGGEAGDGRRGSVNRSSMEASSPTQKVQRRNSFQPPQPLKRKIASFDQFIVWYSSSEMRPQ